MLGFVINLLVLFALVVAPAQAQRHLFSGKYDVEGRSIPGTDIVIRVDTFVENGLLDFVVVQSNTGRLDGEVFECIATQGGIWSAELKTGAKRLSLIGTKFLVLIIDNQVIYCDKNPFDMKTWTDEIYLQPRVDLALKEALVERGIQVQTD